MIKRPLIFLLAALVVACPQPTMAEERSQRPTITDAQVYVVGMQLVSDVYVENLFSERVAGTVQSGLPALVELLYRLLEGKSSVVHQGIVAYELRYDIWEDRYLVTDVDSIEVYATFETMKNAMEGIRVPCGDVDLLDAGRDYTVEVGIAIHPLRGKDKREIEGWVSENVGGGTAGSQRTQVLNLNEMIEHFFRRNKDDANRSEWFRSPVFRSGQLPVRGVE